MPSAMRMVRSGVLVLAIGFTAPALAGETIPAATSTACESSTAHTGDQARDNCSQAAIMDLWLATSLALILLYYRRRRRMR